MVGPQRPGPGPRGRGAATSAAGWSPRAAVGAEQPLGVGRSPRRCRHRPREAGEARRGHRGTAGRPVAVVSAATRRSCPQEVTGVEKSTASRSTCRRGGIRVELLELRDVDPRRRVRPTQRARWPQMTVGVGEAAAEGVQDLPEVGPGLAVRRVEPEQVRDVSGGAVGRRGAAAGTPAATRRRTESSGDTDPSSRRMSKRPSSQAFTAPVYAAASRCPDG